VKSLGSYFYRARRRMTSQTGEPLCRPIRKLSVFLVGGVPTNRRPGVLFWRLVVDQLEGRICRQWRSSIYIII
jgi:hypothetical protein